MIIADIEKLMPASWPARPANIPILIAVVTRAAPRAQEASVTEAAAGKPPKTASIVPSSGLLGILFLGTSFVLTMARKLKLVLCRSLALAILLLGLCQASLGQGDADLEAPGLAPFPTTLAGGGVTLFENVRIFDGKSDTLSAPSNVLVRGNTIERISVNPITVDAKTKVLVISADGRVLMPGLIDAHWHAFMAATSQALLMTADSSYLHLLAARQAEATLMRGFTTVRDCGGPVFGLKRAIDEGS